MEPSRELQGMKVRAEEGKAEEAQTLVDPEIVKFNLALTGKN